jgi:hypothetical protein
MDVENILQERKLQYQSGVIVDGLYHEGTKFIKRLKVWCLQKP